jgi:hypothetical protein
VLLITIYPSGLPVAAVNAVLNEVVATGKAIGVLSERIVRIETKIDNYNALNEKVSQNCIELIGHIADKGADEVSPKEWMRICFDLL